MPSSFLTAPETAAIARALADPRRYDIMTELAAADGLVPCCALSDAGKVSASTMTHHLQQLERAGLVEIMREGRFAVLRFRRDHYERYLQQLAADAEPR